MFLQAQCANLRKYDIYALVPTKQDILEVGAYISTYLNHNPQYFQFLYCTILSLIYYYFLF